VRCHPLRVELTPQSDELRSIVGPSRYVMEVNGGWCATRRVARRTRIVGEIRAG
jgi:uncharacterized membrane protein (UPF0127 family)